MPVQRKLKMEDANHAQKSCTDLQLRANMGLPDSITRTFLEQGGLGRRVIALANLPFHPLLKVIFFIITKMSWKFKAFCCVNAFKLWLALHKVLPKVIARRAISDSVSLEAHALHNVLWWARLFPVPVWMMRFSLSQLSTSWPPEAQPVWIDSDLTPGLRSAYVRLTSPSETNPRVLFWAFGGAFLGGDVEGNRGLAERFGRLMKCDVFLVDMRLCPENKAQDAVLDLYRGYEWLLQKIPAENVIMLGISSGGGAVLRALQLAKSDDAGRQNYFGERLPLPPALPQPAGAILLGAFVDYTRVSESMKKNATYDWIVSPSVLEVALPLKEACCGGKDKLEICSPLHQDMQGLCPLMVSVSEHECLIDEDRELAVKAKDAGVDVVFSTRPHMCHVYQVLSRYLPEAQEEEARICDWVRSRGGAWA